MPALDRHLVVRLEQIVVPRGQIIVYFGGVQFEHHLVVDGRCLEGNDLGRDTRTRESARTVRPPGTTDPAATMDRS